jgi:hypothetical protein
MANKLVQLKDKNKNNIFSVPYFPIGYIYLSTSSINPSEIFGGVWEPIKDRFLLLAGDTYKGGSTGGTSNHSHSAGSLVACYDPQNYYNNALFRVKNVSGGWTLSGYFSESRIWNSGGGDTGRGIEVIGDTGSSNNMPPYLVIYGWVKVSN